jgi:hypothetical protein
MKMQEKSISPIQVQILFLAFKVKNKNKKGEKNDRKRRKNMCELQQGRKDSDRLLSRKMGS